MEERKLNEKESLELISQMILNTQQRFQKNNAVPFLAFGYATVLVSIAIWFALKTTQNPMWNLLWFLIPILGNISMKLFFPERKKMVKTFIDTAITYVWMVTGIVMILLSISTFFIRHDSILSEITILMGMAVTITGLLSKMRIITVAGTLTLLSSFVLSFKLIYGLDTALYFAAVFFLFMIVPGHILYAKKETKNV